MTTPQQFCQAVDEGEVDKVAQILDQSPELVHSKNSTGQSAVLLAVYRGHSHMVALLRERGAELDLCDAAAIGNLERITTLLAQAPESLQSRSTDGWTPLHLACFFGWADAAHRLLDAGADVAVWSDNATRNTPLHAALAGVRESELIKRLLDAGADVNAAGGGGVTPLHLAAARGDLVLIEVLLVHGARSTQTEAGEWPVDLAEDRGHPEAAERLRNVI